MREEGIKTLDDKEQLVIRARTGLDEEFKTRKQVAELIKKSVERVRQIENQGLRKLRHPSRSRQLRVFIEYTNKECPYRFTNNEFNRGCIKRRCMMFKPDKTCHTGGYCKLGIN